MHFHSFSYLTEEAECFLWSVQWTWNHLKQTSHLIQNWPSSYVSLHSVQIKFFFSRQIFIFYTTLDFLRGQLDFLCGVFDGAGISFVAFVNFLIFFEAVFDFFFFLYSCFLYYFFSLFFLFFLLQNKLSYVLAAVVLSTYLISPFSELLDKSKPNLLLAEYLQLIH